MKIGLIFPDYGSQFVGMAKELYDESRIIQEYFEEASTCLNINFVKLCFASSEAELAKPEHAYVSIFLVSSAIAAYLKELGVKPDCVAGFNIGEYSAVCSAQGLTLPDGLYFLAKYAQFYQTFLADTAVKALNVKGLTSLKLKRLCQEASKNQDYVSIAAYLTDDEYTIAGTVTAVDYIVDQAQGALDIEEISAEAGLHSDQMKSVADQLKPYLEKIDFHDLAVPLCAGLDGKKISKGSVVKYSMMKQIISPVRWDKVLKTIDEWDVVIEVGPGTMLSSLVRTYYPTKDIITINKPSDGEMVQKKLSMVQDLPLSESSDL